MREDGKISLDIRAIIITEDSVRIALSADGVGIPVENGLMKLYEDVQLNTAFKAYQYTSDLVGGNRRFGCWKNLLDSLYASLKYSSKE